MGTYNRKGFAPGSHTAEMIERREAAIERVRELLAGGPMLTATLAERLGVPTRTAYGYLAHMESMGEVHKVASLDHEARKFWCAGEKPDAEGTRTKGGARALVVPARQEGKQRDPLIAALFGPAQHA